MADGIWVKYTEMSAVNDKLKRIVSELDEAGSRTDELAGAIGEPFSQPGLKDKAHDFESRWDNRRKDLSRDIKKVQEHVQGVLDGLKDWDQQTAAQFEVDATGEHEPRRG